MGVGRGSLIIFASFAALLLAASSASALIPPVQVQGSKSAGGPYTDSNVAATVKSGKTKLFFIRATRPGMASTDGGYTFDDAATGNDPGYKVKWYKGKKPRKSKEISNQVEGAGYSFEISVPGKSKYFTAEVKVVNDQDPLCLGGQATDPDYPASDAAYFNVNGNCTRARGAWSMST